MNFLESPTESTITEWLDQPKIAKCGHFFIPSSDIWRPDISQPSINTTSVKQLFTGHWSPWARAALVYRIRCASQHSICNLASLFKVLSEKQLDPLRTSDLAKIRERLRPADFSNLTSFIRFWHQCEDFPFRPHSTLVKAYNELPRKKIYRREILSSIDPLAGPLTYYERDALFHWVCDAFIDNQITLDQFVFLRLLFAYGARSANFQQLVFGDLLAAEEGQHKIRLPKAKQRGTEHGYRNSFVTFGLSKDLHELLSSLRSYVLERLKIEYPGVADWDLAIKNVPVFRRVAVEHGNFGETPIIMASNDLKGLEASPDSQFHKPITSFRAWVNFLPKTANYPISERTGEAINLNIRRFRYTLGTDMANEGYSAAAIAEALTHSDTRSAGNYIKTSIKMSKRIDEKLKDSLSVVVNAFSGVIVSDRHAARNGERPDRQINDLAVCGSDRQCNLEAPFSCYPCSKFQPFLHADHQRVLNELEARQAMSSENPQNTASVYDRSILACRRVIHECQKTLNSLTTHEDNDGKRDKS